MRYKDVNECLLAGVEARALQQCLRESQDFAPTKVKAAGEFRDALMKEWFAHDEEPGFQLPFGFPWRVRMGELTVWTGVEKSGKTTLLQFVLMGLMAQGERALVASFEVRAPRSLKKMSRQAWGGLIRDLKFEQSLATQAERDNYKAACVPRVDEVLAWFEDKLWLYDHTGIAHWRQVLDDIRWARRRHGITQFVVDNFMRLGIAKDDYAQQADAITAYAQLAMDLEVHIHLVAHQNKEGGGKRSVAGAHEIIAAAHNIVGVERDEKKAQQASELWNRKETGELSDQAFKEAWAAVQEAPDGRFILYAQRDGEDQNASRHLWFLWESQQYCGFPPSHKAYQRIQFTQPPPPPPKDDPYAEVLEGWGAPPPTENL